MEPKRVLCVDDDQQLLSVMRLILEDAGYYAAVLDRSAGVLDSIKAQQPDLLITDMYMPGGWDGATVIAALRAAGYTLPVLILTALEDHDGSLAGHRLLKKPLDIDTLTRTVEEMIGPAMEPA